MKTPEEIAKLANEKYPKENQWVESLRTTWAEGYTQCQQDNAEKKYTEEDMLGFALFHANRMSGGQQSDNKFYAKQSFDLLNKQGEWKT